MTNKRAWEIIQTAMAETESKYNVTVNNLDMIRHSFGSTGNNTIEIPSFNFESLSKTDPEGTIVNEELFSVLCSLGHERKHCDDDQNIRNMSFEHQLFYYISNNLHDYYHFNQNNNNYYYRNDYHEVNAEFYGLEYAYKIISLEIGQKDAADLLKTYVNEETKAGTYYIPCKQYETCNDIIDAFKQKKANVMHFNFPFPSVEPVCNPLSNDYKSITHGIDQLAVIAGRTFTARNYEQNDVITEYSKDFWIKVKSICNKYPQFGPYINIPLQNDYGTTVENDLTEIGVNIPTDDESYTINGENQQCNR